MSTPYRSPKPGWIEQTSILREVEVPHVKYVEGAAAEVGLTPYPWLIVLTQECDLQLDRLARLGEPQFEGKAPIGRDKMLKGILLCPAYSEDLVLAGTYIEGASKTDKSTRDAIHSNRHERFHRLRSYERYLSESIVVDFKFVLSTAPEFLHSLLKASPAKAVAVLEPPYRDRLMQRFLNYFGRIAEPEPD